MHFMRKIQLRNPQQKINLLTLLWGNLVACQLEWSGGNGRSLWIRGRDVKKPSQLGLEISSCTNQDELDLGLVWGWDVRE